MNDAERVALAARLKEARLRAALVQKEEVTKEGMAALISAEIGRTLHATQWRRYESGESEPSLEIIRAAAKVSELTQAYIAFGADPNALINPATDRKLTLEEEQRASAAAAHERATRTASGRKRGRPGGR